MKKTVITTVAALVLGTAGVTYAVQGSDKPIDDELHQYEMENEEVLADEVVNDQTSDFEEYDVIADKIDVNNLEAEVVEDNKGKRVLLFADEDGHEQYKTIYTKKKGYVKIISFDGGQIFVGTLDGEKVEEDSQTSSESKASNKEITSSDKEITSSDKEAATVAKHIDLDEYTGKVVEDNKGKRVIVYEDSNGHEQYKSIFVKKKNFVKVIDFNGGLLYKGTIKDSKNAPAEKKETEKVAEKESKQTEQVTKEEPKKAAKKSSSSIDQYTEAGTIANHINLDKYTGKVVEDNKGKRVIVFSDDNGNKQYKSIYVKRNGFLKIIDFDGGMIYKGK